MHLKLKEIIFILLISLASAAIFNSVSVSGVSYIYKPQIVKNNSILSLYETKNIFDANEGLFIDARPKSQYKRDHIKGAVNVPYNSSEKENLMRGIEHNQNIIVYCYSKRCNQARRLAKDLEKLGYTQVALFEDGIVEWKKAKYPVEVVEN
ncbi:MAG: rhodanese-like domain-containing protein [Calditrichaeota bacterium]|nr:rhodanese-like domain-containing protein [Calditrichota bacterium]